MLFVHVHSQGHIQKLMFISCIAHSRNAFNLDLVILAIQPTTNDYFDANSAVQKIADLDVYREPVGEILHQSAAMSNLYRANPIGLNSNDLPVCLTELAHS